MSYLPGQ